MELLRDVNVSPGPKRPRRDETRVEEQRTVEPSRIVFFIRVSRCGEFVVRRNIYLDSVQCSECTNLSLDEHSRGTFRSVKDTSDNICIGEVTITVCR